MEINIIDLIPVGKENAIKREQLTRLCFQYGLIADVKDKDRAMRDLIGEARMEHPIINMSHGDGYYQPRKDSKEEMAELNAFYTAGGKKGNKFYSQSWSGKSHI